MSLITWVRSWEAAMNEAGYPNARLNPYFDGDHWTYTWLTDLDAQLDATYEQTHAAWNVAHTTFVAVDDLRPIEVWPSPKLQEILWHIQ